MCQRFKRGCMLFSCHSGILSYVLGSSVIYKSCVCRGSVSTVLAFVPRGFSAWFETISETNQ